MLKTCIFAVVLLSFIFINNAKHSNINLKLKSFGRNFVISSALVISSYSVFDISNYLLLNNKFESIKVAVADDIVVNNNKVSEEEEARIKRKLEKQKNQFGAEVKSKETELEDKSYLGSLQKEKMKQEARKKTKQERAKDLCETLGRGC